jgi:tetratricopeptide (TPR) repeat protein
MNGQREFGKSIAASLLAFLLAAAVLPCPAYADGQVSGERAVVAGRDINARDIIVKYGLTEQEVLALVRETREKEGPLAEKLAEFAQKLGVTESAVQNFFRILGEKQVPPERLLETLGDIAQRHLESVNRLAILQPKDPVTDKLVQDARSAIEAGDYDRADLFLRQAETAELAAVGMAEELARQAREAADQRRLNAAAILSERGELSLTRLNYLEAAQHFAAAAQRVPPGHEGQTLAYLDRETSALYQQGDEFGDNLALTNAIDRYGALLKRRTRDRAPLQWAATQTNLGTALWRLGERESGTKRLEEAVAAYRAALQEWTRERVPLDWAKTQTNLGTALWRLGERESGTKRLEEAVAAYRAALQEGTRDRAPLDWAAAQHNLGIALMTLGERESGTKRLEEAVVAYEAALQERRRERVLLDWAETQNNLGTALSTLGKRTHDGGQLEEARKAISAAFNVFMEAGQQQRRSYFEDRLHEIDRQISALKTAR